MKGCSDMNKKTTAISTTSFAAILALIVFLVLFFKND